MSFLKFSTFSTPSYFGTQQNSHLRALALKTTRRQCEQTELFITQQMILRDAVQRNILAVPRIARIEKVGKVANLENDIASLNSPSIQMPYPKLMVMVSFYWKRNFLPSKIVFIDDVLEINDQSRCIISGPPCIGHFITAVMHINAFYKIE